MAMNFTKGGRTKCRTAKRLLYAIKKADNASWATPVTVSESFQGERLKRKLTDYVQSMPDIITAYGGAPIEYFTIYIEPLGSGSYRIYFLY